MEQLVQEILKLKEEKNAVIMAHYYVDGSVQEIADYVGDSFYLSKVATQVEQDVIVFCGVSFMGESARILNPKKKVIMPDITADCPMAHMVDCDTIRRVREEYKDLAVVCYVNSTAQIKSVSDVCVTSSNAVKVVRELPNQNIFFIPDNNLGRYVAEKLPEKNFIFHDGYCPVHKKITAEHLVEKKELYPGALVLTHPECVEEIVMLSDFIGSTQEIIEFATKSEKKEFIVATETGVFYELQQKNPDKVFYTVEEQQVCPDMKKITLEKVRNALVELAPQIHVDAEVIEKSKKPLERMLELASK